MNPLTELIDWLNTPIIWGIPAWVFVIIFILILIWILRPKDKPFQRKDTVKEIKKEFDNLFKAYSTPINKRLDVGSTKNRYIFKSIPIFWDKNISILKNLQTDRQLRRFLKANPVKKDGVTGGLVKEYEELICYKVSGHGIFLRALGSVNFGISYILIPRELVNESKDVVVIDPTANPSYFFGTTIYNQSGREFLENLVYKFNRKNELDEFANQIPKQNYLEVNTASIVARAREKAKIEKEKYRGQIEGAEEG